MPIEHARSVQSTWYYTLVSILFFVGFIDGIAMLSLLDRYLETRDSFLLVVVAAFAVAAAVHIRYCWFLRVGRAGGLPALGWTIALVVTGLVVWVLGLLAPGSELATAIPLWAAASLIACLVPRSLRWPALAVGAATFVAHMLLAAYLFGEPLNLFANGGALVFFIYAVALPLMLLSSLWWWEIVVRLDRHRRTAAELAITQERLRFASDLHDIQGHHLQVISLKSELAERLLDVDPKAAREHIHETRLIAKQALEETRSLVAGYRQVAFDDELENAREVLTAAGASCALRIGEVPENADVRSALASVVREATTNILRHSEATRVTITLVAEGDTAVLRIENDGVRAETDALGSAAFGARVAGNGLAGLRERLAAIGGRLDTQVDASGASFELTASVPVVPSGARVGAAS